VEESWTRLGIGFCKRPLSLRHLHPTHSPLPVDKEQRQYQRPMPRSRRPSNQRQQHTLRRSRPTKSQLQPQTLRHRRSEGTARIPTPRPSRIRVSLRRRTNMAQATTIWILNPTATVLRPLRHMVNRKTTANPHPQLHHLPHPHEPTPMATRLLLSPRPCDEIFPVGTTRRRSTRPSDLRVPTRMPASQRRSCLRSQTATLS
jgi:hypothetical protein